MKAWWFNEVSYAQNPDQRLPHMFEPDRPVSLEDLKKLGLLYWHVPTEDWEPQINIIAKERDYKSRDRISTTKEGFGDNYDSMLKMFFEEHFHEDEEIRYVLDGSGYFDVRDFKTDEWIRILAEPGDLLVVPAGIYHRFTLDEKNAVDVVRLFQVCISAHSIQQRD
ncbi:Acireductone dioxygenase [Clavulina sp. PMI_390]|nr:Acireductone dioxygenase [Clavulina sp. PMI_390]